MTDRLTQRFRDKYDAGDPADCWEWTACRSPQGYGKLAAVIAGKREQLAHRVAYIMEHGSIPNGLHVLHHCDNPPCVNPRHLFLGTNADNVSDRQKKGRGKPPKPMSRSEHPLTRFSETDVADMVDMYQRGCTQASIAKKYATYQQVVSKIVRPVAGVDSLNRRARGTSSANGKLTEEQVKSIRLRYRSGESQSALAGEHHVSQATVSAAILRKTFAYLED